MTNPEAAQLPGPVLWSVEETAAILNVSVTTVWVLIRGGQLGSIKVKLPTGRGLRALRRIEQTAIDEFLASNRVSATSP